DLQSKVDELKQDIMSRESQIIDLMEKLSSIKKNEGIIVERYENRISELKSEMNSLEVSLKEKSQELDDANLLLSKYSISIKEAEDHILKTSKELEESKNALDESAASCSNLEAQLNSAV